MKEDLTIKKTLVSVYPLVVANLFIHQLIHRCNPEARIGLYIISEM